MMCEKRLYKLLEFPKHLQVTLVTLLKLGRATATEISAVYR